MAHWLKRLLGLLHFLPKPDSKETGYGYFVDPETRELRRITSPDQLRYELFRIDTGIAVYESWVVLAEGERI